MLRKSEDTFLFLCLGSTTAEGHKWVIHQTRTLDRSVCSLCKYAVWFPHSALHQETTHFGQKAHLRTSLWYFMALYGAFTSLFKKEICFVSFFLRRKSCFMENDSTGHFYGTINTCGGEKSYKWITQWLLYSNELLTNLYEEAALKLIVRSTTLPYIINPCNFNYVWSRVSNKNANEMPWSKMTHN